MDALPSSTLRLPAKTLSAEETSGRERPASEGALAIHLVATALLCLVPLVIWIPIGGYFWPIWVWFGVSLPFLAHLLVQTALAALDAPRERGFAIHAGLALLITTYQVILWILSGFGYFWPIWVAIGLGLTVTIHALIAFGTGQPLTTRERELRERVGQLSRTRRGALDVQAAELRRIERDLHDGAQSRLVALSMQLGRAEERVKDRPEAVELLRAARGEASAAISELRDLARGIAPPVLADRGLAAAVQALAERASGPVEVDVRVTGRPAPVVETAAYFIVAEALTNAAKHAPRAAARVAIEQRGETLQVVIADDGPGQADPAGGGLTGLRNRAEALDGTLTVTDSPSGGTLIRGELPCAQ